MNPSKPQCSIWLGLKKVTDRGGGGIRPVLGIQATICRNKADPYRLKTKNLRRSKGLGPYLGFSDIP